MEMQEPVRIIKQNSVWKNIGTNMKIGWTRKFRKSNEQRRWNNK